MKHADTKWLHQTRVILISEVQPLRSEQAIGVLFFKSLAISDFHVFCQGEGRSRDTEKK